MAALGKKLRTTNDGLMFWCPGCDSPHGIRTAPGGWTFDGNADAPTFAPSVLMTGTQRITDEEADRILRGEKFEPLPLLCHTFVRAGRIEFLGDCLHALAGQTVELPDWPNSFDD